jgi:hypothetical protein
MKQARKLLIYLNKPAMPLGQAKQSPLRQGLAGAGPWISTMLSTEILDFA